MLIYPDSSDLINLCRGKSTVSLAELAQKLDADSHRVVLSLDTVIELAALLRNGLLLEVRRDLNQLEQLPLIFVNEGRIANLEIEEASRAFEQHREYDSTAVDPFARRLADAIDIFGARQFITNGRMRVPTEMLVNYGIAETVLYVWRSDPLAFDVQRRREEAWIRLMDNDRSMAVIPDLADHFATAMARNLPLRRIRSPALGTEKFARWVYESPSRCPGVRLVYETQHRLRRDTKTRARASDLIDLSRIHAVPYVDLFVTDSAMMMYCRQAVAEMGASYPQLVGDLQAVISHLS
jgi:hypothetical protein